MLALAMEAALAVRAQCEHAAPGASATGIGAIPAPAKTRSQRARETVEHATQSAAEQAAFAMRSKHSALAIIAAALILGCALTLGVPRKLHRIQPHQSFQEEELFPSRSPYECLTRP